MDYLQDEIEYPEIIISESEDNDDDNDDDGDDDDDDNRSVISTSSEYEDNHMDQDEPIQASPSVAVTVGSSTVTVNIGESVSISCQTTPGLKKLSNNVSPCKSDKKENKGDTASCSNTDAAAEEDQGCPICFEPWSNSGAHRLSSLLCGHLFGRSCIERWLKGKNVDKCPQCNHPAKRKDIRNIYAKAITAIDTADRDKALKDLEEEKNRRSKAEQEKARVILQFELAKAEIQMLKQQLKTQQSTSKGSNTFTLNTTYSERDSENGKSTEIQKKFSLQKTIHISLANARVMTYDYCRGILAISKPSPNQLFPGFGVVKISSFESRSSEFVSIHQKPIRDAAFCNQGDLLLTGAVDKLLKVTSMSCNSVVQSYTCPAAVWSCTWNTENSNYVYAGLQNGSCLLFDTRNTYTFIKDIKPSNMSCRPIVSLAYVPPQASSKFSPEGVLLGTLNGGYFLENTEADYLPYTLPFPEGSCTCLSFDDLSRHCLLSQRPSKTFPKTRHLVYELTGSGIGGQLNSHDEANEAGTSSSSTTVCSCRLVQQCVGGNMNRILSRSTLFSYPDEPSQIFACSGDESSNSAIVWNARTSDVVQRLPAIAGDQIIDSLAFTANNDNLLSMITEKKLAIYKWT